MHNFPTDLDTQAIRTLTAPPVGVSNRVRSGAVTGTRTVASDRGLAGVCGA